MSGVPTPPPATSNDIELPIIDDASTPSVLSLQHLAESCAALASGEKLSLGSKRYTRTEACLIVLQKHAATQMVVTTNTTEPTHRDEPLTPQVLSSIYTVLGESLERHAAGKNLSTVDTGIKVHLNPSTLSKDEKRRQVGTTPKGYAAVKMNPAQCLQKALDLDMNNARAWYILGCIVSNIHQELSPENDIGRDGDNAGTLTSRKIRKVALESKVRRGEGEDSSVKLASGRFTTTQCFTQAIALNPKLSGAWLNLGSALARDAARHAAEMKAITDPSKRTAAPPPCVIAGEVITREACYIHEISLDFRDEVTEDDPKSRPPENSIVSGPDGNGARRAVSEDRPKDDVPQHRRRARAFAWLNLSGCLQGLDHTITIHGVSFTRKRCLIRSIVECPDIPMAWTNLAANMYGEEVALIPSSTIPGHNMRVGQVECLIKAIELAGKANDTLRQSLAPTAYPWVNIAAVLFEEMTNDGRMKRSECTLLPLSSASLSHPSNKEDKLFDCIDCIEEALNRDPKHYMAWYNAALMLSTLEEDRVPPPSSTATTAQWSMLGSPQGAPVSTTHTSSPSVRRPSITVLGITYATPVHCLIQSLTIEEEHGDAWFQLGQQLYYCPKDPSGDATAEVNGQVYSSEECYSRASSMNVGSRTRCCTIQ